MKMHPKKKAALMWQMSKLQELRLLMRSPKKDDEYVKLKAAKIDKIVALASELSLQKHRSKEHIAGLRVLLNSLSQTIRYGESIQNEVSDFSAQLNSAAYDENSKKNFKHVLSDYKNIETIFNNTISAYQVSNEHDSRLIDELQQEVFHARMVTIGEYIQQLKRTVRDIVKDSSKKIRLQFEGLQTELDKWILEDLKDPMIHLIRNAIDHGIEEPGIRIKSGKPEEGTIKISAYATGSEVTIRISDDGSGINVKTVGKRAVEKGVIDKKQLEKLSSQEVLSLIFKPGFSTKEGVTRVSGRGVGMDVVKTNLEKIHGYIQIDNNPGNGVCFVLKIPVTLAAFNAVLCRLGAFNFFIQSIAVEKVIRINSNEKRPEDKISNVVVQDISYPYTYLGDYYSFETRPALSQGYFLVILRSGNATMALEVDECIEQQEIVIKPLADIVSNIPGISGIVTMSDGSIAYVLESSELIDRLQDNNTGKAPGKSWIISSVSKSLLQSGISVVEETEFNIAQDESTVVVLHCIIDGRHYGIPVQSVEQVYNIMDSSQKEKINSLYDSVLVFDKEAVSLEECSQSSSSEKNIHSIQSGEAALLLNVHNHKSIIMPDKLLSIEVFDRENVDRINKTGKWKDILPDIIKIKHDASLLH